MQNKTDFLVIGAGIAGVSVAAQLSERASVRILESESQPAYHATGRSAALYAPGYGNTTIRIITDASQDFFFNPEPGFAEHTLVKPRDRLYLAREEDMSALLEQSRDPDDDLTLLDGAEVCRRFPLFSRDYVAAALLGAGSADLDVDAILQGYLRRFKKFGGVLNTASAVTSLRKENGHWKVSTQTETYFADVVVNAGGAWADTVAEMSGAKALGLSPLRRTAVMIPAPAGQISEDFPMVLGPNESFYFKPDAGAILLSPADETLSVPCDAQPDELDIAIAVDAFETCTATRVAKVTHSWAGLRTFAPDRTPVVGFDANGERFFWLAGQGGYGVQTAPVMAILAASLLLEDSSLLNKIPGNADFEQVLECLSPLRF